MSPLTFHGSKVGEDPQIFLDEVYKKVYTMDIYSSEKPKLALYKLKEVSHVWYI